MSSYTPFNLNFDVFHYFRSLCLVAAGNEELLIVNKRMHCSVVTWPLSMCRFGSQLHRGKNFSRHRLCIGVVVIITGTENKSNLTWRKYI